VALLDYEHDEEERRKLRWKRKSERRKQLKHESKKRAISEDNILLIMFGAKMVIDAITWIILYTEVFLSLVTRNSVVMGMFWVSVWAFMSIYVASLRPYPSMWQIVLGPIGYIMHQPPHKRASIIFQLFCICFYALAASQLDTEMIFRYSYLLSQLSIMCYLWSERKTVTHTVITTLPGRSKQNSGISHMFIFANEYIYYITKKRYDNLLNSMGEKPDSHNLNKPVYRGHQKHPKNEAIAAGVRQKKNKKNI